jgi:hypothetical protein
LKISNFFSKFLKFQFSKNFKIFKTKFKISKKFKVQNFKIFTKKDTTISVNGKLQRENSKYFSWRKASCSPGPHCQYIGLGKGMNKPSCMCGMRNVNNI